MARDDPTSDSCVTSSDSSSTLNRINHNATGLAQRATPAADKQNSVPTARLVYTNSKIVKYDSEAEAEIERELQAAVDMVIEGSPLQAEAPTSSALVDDKTVISPKKSAFSPTMSRVSERDDIQLHPSNPFSPVHLAATTLCRKFSLKRTASVEGPTKKSGADSSTLLDKRSKCTMCEPYDWENSHPFIKRFHPLIRWLQERPLITCCITVGLLVVLLIAIIVILVVGVFPNMMRAIVQDVSLRVTNLHAVPPPEYLIAIGATINDGTDGSKRDLVGSSGVNPHARTAGEPDTPASDSLVGSSALRIPVSQTSSIVALAIPWGTAATQMSAVASTSYAFQASSAAIVSSSPPPNQISSSAVVLSQVSHHGRHNRADHEPAMEPQPKSKPSRGALLLHRRDEVEPSNAGKTVDVVIPVTFTHTGTSTVHLSQPHSTLMPRQTAAAMEATNRALASGEKYTIQMSGNMTSDAPVGVTMEFTEPLQMFWRDVEIGVVNKPESIHLPGKGETRWSWPPVEVTIPNADLGTGERKAVIPSPEEQPGSMRTPFVITDKDMVLGGLGSRMRKRATSDGSVDSSLADWFDTVKEHRSFTMQWRSTVRVSALGLHTSNVRFEKTVHVVCNSANQCSLNGPALSKQAV
ncbi:hypothetical protein EC988_000281 [Linderina pennispora]|nr:hypothetical protein EC988_000281 [Linderina pennispora]